MKIEILEEIRKDYKKEKQKLADEITKAIEYNKKLDEQKINMVELNNKMYEQNKKIKQLNEVIKREKNKKTETQNDTKEQLVKKVAQALLMDEIERYRKAPNCDVNQTIIEHESRICLEKARKVVEFLEKVEE